jgi:hypothetical protein
MMLLLCCGSTSIGTTGPTAASRRGASRTRGRGRRPKDALATERFVVWGALFFFFLALTLRRKEESGWRESGKQHRQISTQASISVFFFVFRQAGFHNNNKNASHSTNTSRKQRVDTKQLNEERTTKKDAK